MLNTVLSYFWDNSTEIIAVIAGIAGVYLTAKEKIWCWPVGMVNVVLSAIVFYQVKLYQDSILQLFYFVMTVYGFYYWLKGGANKKAPQITHITVKTFIAIMLSGGVSTFVFGWFFKHYTDASLPYLDATTTIWGIITTFLMARKIIEHWIFWIIIDLLCTAIYFYKHLYFFSLLYLFFTILAVYGLMEWRKKIKTAA